jgi:23S rRNA pseudouridine1911/1915/1917 synthase
MMESMAEALQVLYEDNHCLAVAKPAPLLTQAPPLVPSLETMAREYLKERYYKKGRVYLGVPHRLDRPVSGVVLFARSTKAAQRISEQFQKRQVTKTYWGAVEGTVAPAEGMWEDWLRKLENEARVERVESGTPGAQLARMHYRTIQACNDGTLLEFLPETGRMHQIRVQAAVRGWPIRGDDLYRARLPFGPSTDLARERIIALHARSLTFLHPIRYEPMTVTAPLPAVWNELGVDTNGLQAVGLPGEK